MAIDIDDNYFSTKDRLILQGCLRLGFLIGLVESCLLFVELGPMLPGNDEVRAQLNEGLFVLQDLLDGIIECLAEKLDGLKVGLEEVRRRLEFVGHLADLGVVL